jgi:hypothetical protein
VHAKPTNAVVEAYGARLSLDAPDPETLHAMLARLPPGWALSSANDAPGEVGWRFAIRRAGDGYHLAGTDEPEQRCADLDEAADALRTHMRRYVGHYAPDLVFVHAGVVARHGRAILLPGPSLAGKSTLVAALVRAGAEYYSDEFALIDDAGLVHPYLEPLALRDQPGADHGSADEPVADGLEARAPVPVGLLVITAYEHGGTWAPRTLTAATGVVAVMEHTLPSRQRPAQALAVLRRALSGATALQGPRGDAPETAEALLEAAGRAAR